MVSSRSTEPGIFAFDEAGDEKAKLAKWAEEDPISLQDAYNTSAAFLEHCEGDTIV
jgi:hypothetical protein